MKNISSLSLRFHDGQLSLLDQRQLPHHEEWITIETPDEMVEAILALKVRGAPAIGVAAAMALSDYAHRGASQEDFFAAAERLRAARPTAVNLMNAIDRMKSVAEANYSVEAIEKAAEAIFDEDVELCERIAENGALFIEDGDNVLTHCNTGGLATAGVGTALGVIRKAHEQGKKIHVYVDETRPLLQGGRLTTWELQKLGIPYTLISDNMAGFLMAQGRVQKVIVGADRIACNGDFANKVGTYSLGVLCFHHRIPFYVAAPYTTVDPDCQKGQEIPIEERKPEEVRGVSGKFGDVTWAPLEGQVYNPAFDVTPAEFVSAWIMDTAALTSEDVKNGQLVRREKA